MSKRFLKYAAMFTVMILSLIALYFLAAFCLSKITVNNNTFNKKEIAIYIMTNGIHTDIVLPASNFQKDWTQEIKYEHTLLTDTSYKFLAFGWGDRKFYLETPEFSDLKLSTGLRAISGLSTSAMHTTYYLLMTEDRNCKKLYISKVQYQQLIKYISASFTKDNNGHFISIKSNIHYDNADAFYEAVGSYSIFKTCNTWTNNALKASGQKACFWTIFDTPILQKYQ
ncbi:TIGR02117 family protein [Pedobacter sp. Leaf250]|uniref:TIGR02117 family protein n=1 Tax=Pedobacter sp. Leaf250 TaxID=2876559 RepID=UPI001E5AD823|nr:TIGR02117 family protein [Pedobacter sp. Leaf250]